MSLAKYRQALKAAEKRGIDYEIAKEEKEDAESSAADKRKRRYEIAAEKKRRRYEMFKERKEDADETVHRLAQQLAASNHFDVRWKWDIDAVKALIEQTGWDGLVTLKANNDATMNMLTNMATQAQLRYLRIKTLY